MEWLVWVEEEPDTVVVARSRLALFWKLNGPMGLAASLRGKRMRYWNGWDGSHDPISEAHRIEAGLNKRHAEYLVDALLGPVISVNEE